MLGGRESLCRLSSQELNGYHYRDPVAGIMSVGLDYFDSQTTTRLPWLFPRNDNGDQQNKDIASRNLLKHSGLSQLLENNSVLLSSIPRTFRA